MSSPDSDLLRYSQSKYPRTAEALDFYTCDPYTALMAFEYET